jgi:hypothetical protein
MSDNIGQIIRRDLDSIPVLPRTRWTPTPRPAPMMPVLALAGTVMLALAVGVAVAFQWDGDHASAAARPQTETFVVGGETFVTRQAVLASLVRTTTLGRITRFEAKLSRQVHSLDGISSTGPWWVVAITGETPCRGCAAPVSWRSATYWVDARTGRVASTVALAEYWPAAFDRMVDEYRSPDSRQVTGRLAQVGPDGRLTFVIEVGTATERSGTRLTVRTDGNTAYVWGSGLAGGNALSFEEMVRDSHLTLESSARVTVAIAGVPDADGSLRAETVTAGVGSK